jgi:hypothetical protein
VHGAKAAQGDDHQVGGDYYPTSLWQIGETLRDEHVVSLDDVTSGNLSIVRWDDYLKTLSGHEIEPFGDAEIGVIELHELIKRSLSF